MHVAAITLAESQKNGRHEMEVNRKIESEGRECRFPIMHVTTASNTKWAGVDNPTPGIDR
jgi:hypothetical protein